MANTERLVRRWSKRIFLMRISIPMILICAILSFSVVGITIYGSRVGNYIIKISDPVGLNLSLSEHNDFDFGFGTSQLSVPGLENMWNTTYTSFMPDKEAHDRFAGLEGSMFQGLPNAERGEKNIYIAYGFYLKNMSKVDGTYRMQVFLEDQIQDVVDAIRIMVIKNGQGTVYGKTSKDGTDPNGTDTPPSDNYHVTPFYDNDATKLSSGKITLIQENGNSIEQGEAVKYTVIFWLEGHDPDCNDKLMRGSIKMSMLYTSY